MHVHNVQRYQMVMAQRNGGNGQVAANVSLGSSSRITAAPQSLPLSSSSSSSMSSRPMIGHPHDDDDVYDSDERLSHRFANLSTAPSHHDGYSSNTGGRSPLHGHDSDHHHHAHPQVPIIGRPSSSSSSTSRGPPPGLSSSSIAPPGFASAPSSSRGLSANQQYSIAGAQPQQQQIRGHGHDHDDHYYERERELQLHREQERVWQQQQQQSHHHSYGHHHRHGSAQYPLTPDMNHHDEYHRTSTPSGAVNHSSVHDGSSSPGLSFFSFGMHIDRRHDSHHASTGTSGQHQHQQHHMSVPISSPVANRSINGYNDHNNDPSLSLGRSPSDSSAAWANSPEVTSMSSALSSHTSHSSVSDTHMNRNNSNTNIPSSNRGHGHSHALGVPSSSSSSSSSSSALLAETSPALSPSAWPTLGSPEGMRGQSMRGPSSTPGRATNMMTRISSTAGTLPPNLNLSSAVSSSSSSASSSSSSSSTSTSSKKAGARRVEDDKREMRPSEDRRVAAPRPKQSRPLHHDVVKRMDTWLNKLLFSLIPRPSTFETRGMTSYIYTHTCVFIVNVMNDRLVEDSS
jgi:hypothetical protein